MLKKLRYHRGRQLALYASLETGACASLQMTRALLSIIEPCLPEVYFALSWGQLLLPYLRRSYFSLPEVYFLSLS